MLERRGFSAGWLLLVIALCGGCVDSLESPLDAASTDDSNPPVEQPAGRAETPAFDPLELEPPPIENWVEVEDFDVELARFESVFWDTEDTVSLRKLIRETPLVEGKRVLEIGTGTGLVSLCCLQAGASRVVATDINPQAVANANYNARGLELDSRFETRLVPKYRPGAYSVIGPQERFDLILSNPPWQDGVPDSIGKYAYYDPGFGLLRSLLAGLRDHLEPGGKALLAYGNVTAIRELQRVASQHGLEVRILDDRDLDSLPENFLPGMLLEVTFGEGVAE
jgi:tRNA1(Val) A37 N6-methylase TrmN6